MKRAISWGMIGLLLGVGIFPLVSVFIFRMPVKEGTSGCIGLVLGVIFFAIALSVDKSKSETDKPE